MAKMHFTTSDREYETPTCGFTLIYCCFLWRHYLIIMASSFDPSKEQPKLVEVEHFVSRIKFQTHILHGCCTPTPIQKIYFFWKPREIKMPSPQHR